jgi:hypothetical protein
MRCSNENPRPGRHANFTGTEQWFRHSLARDITYTEGVQYVAETAGAYWLLDEIAIAQRSVPALGHEEFQVWKLVVTVSPCPGSPVTNRTASLSVEDGNDNVVWTNHISFTDFPEPGIELWFTDKVILLPSEY